MEAIIGIALEQLTVHIYIRRKKESTFVEHTVQPCKWQGRLTLTQHEIQVVIAAAAVQSVHCCVQQRLTVNFPSASLVQRTSFELLARIVEGRDTDVILEQNLTHFCTLYDEVKIQQQKATSFSHFP